MRSGSPLRISGSSAIGWLHRHSAEILGRHVLVRVCRGRSQLVHCQSAGSFRANVSLIADFELNAMHRAISQAVPTIHQILLSTPKPNPIPNIRFIRSCSSALAPATFKRLEEAFHAPVLEAYAMVSRTMAASDSGAPRLMYSLLVSTAD